MSSKPLHQVFTTASPQGLLNSLISRVGIVDAINSQKGLVVEQAIWDTGATSSCINKSIVTKLGLIPTGKVIVHTANGASMVSTYVVSLMLPNSVSCPNLVVSEGDLGPAVDMLIGMDVIAHGDFVVQNNAGKTSFSFCFPAFDDKYDMIEKADKVNSANKK